MFLKNDLIAKQTILCKIKAKKYQTWQYLHKSSKNWNTLYLFGPSFHLCRKDLFLKYHFSIRIVFGNIFYWTRSQKERNANIHIYFCQSECRESSLRSRNKFHFRVFGKLSFSATYPFHSKKTKTISNVI